MDKRQARVDPIDRISMLSDVLLIHVLSFLPTKYAVRTSVLSSRWKPLWTSVPVLDLSYNDFPSRGFALFCEKKRNSIDWSYSSFPSKQIASIGKKRRKAKFLTFVYRFLIHQPSLSKVHLTGMRFDLSVIVSWITLARKHNVIELKLETYFLMEPMEPHDNSPSQDHAMCLDLSLHRLDPLPLHKDSFSYSGKLHLHNSNPSTIELLSSVAKEWNVKELELIAEFHENLREFHQSMFANEMLVVLKLRNMVLNFPKGSIRFPNLKVLHLKEIQFKSNKSGYNLITTGCPVLEELDIERYNWDNILDFNITSLTLRILKVRFVPDYCRKRKLKMLIDAPNLQYLNLHDNTTLHFVVRDLSSLSEAKLGVWIDKKSQYCDETAYGISLFVLLRKICSVEVLSLWNHTLLALQKSCSWHLLTFSKLTCLKICLSTFSIDWEYVSWELILMFLTSSPNLKHLIWQGSTFNFDRPFDMTSQNEVPVCVVSCLEEIDIERLSGEKNEIKLMQYFLQNSKVLKIMRVKFRHCNAETELMKKAILELPKVSNACCIEVGTKKYIVFEEFEDSEGSEFEDSEGRGI